VTRTRARGVFALAVLGACGTLLAACGTPSSTPRPSSGAPVPLPVVASAVSSAPSAPASSDPAASPVASAVPAATLIAFAMVPTAGTGGAAEVSDPDQIDRLTGAPPETVGSARAAVARHLGPGNRLFAFVLSGCRNTGATVAVRAGRVTAALTGGDGVACFAAEWFLAVFAVPATLVPPGTRVG
jgi:hypothetical protein